jgi:hypothetical protein
MNKQTVYIPIKVEDITKRQVTLSTIRGEDVFLHETEAYVLTPEELKQLLEEYTNRIVENIKHIDVGEIGEDGNHYPYYIVDKESITSQIPKFLKEKGI